MKKGCCNCIYAHDRNGKSLQNCQFGVNDIEFNRIALWDDVVYWSHNCENFSSRFINLLRKKKLNEILNEI